MPNYLKLLVLSILFVSCNKDNNNTPAPDVPGTITVTSPSAIAIYTNGNTLKVEGEMTDNNGLSTARVEIRNKTTTALLYQQSSTTGSVSFYRFLWNWTITGITTTTIATVKIVARNKQSNEISREIDVTLDN